MHYMKSIFKYKNYIALYVCKVISYLSFCIYVYLSSVSDAEFTQAFSIS